ncbi:MAG: 4Fe-4S binding protein [Oscillospiraceae bacterium]|nr:4Fe-4S binding protein [Oscillospiraceae bacterium]
MGLGDCVSACVNGGVSVKDGLVRIDYSICNGCGGCAKACPNSVIKILPADTPAFVTCSNKDKGAVARKKCTDACIGCGMCMRKCPNGAIKLENNLAVIDYEKCNGCGTCIEVCPAKCIV